jgi:hypothetical protein
MPFILNPYWTSPPPPEGCTVVFGLDEAPVSNESEYTLSDGPYVLGYYFRTNFARRLTRIGIYKPTQSGINQPSTMDHSVGVWDYTANPGAPVLIWQQDFLASATCVADTTPTVTPYYCWFDIVDGPELDANVDYVVAATWDEPSPVIVPANDISILISGFILNTTAATEQGAVPGMLIDLSSEPYYFPTQSSFLLEKGFLTVNLCLT